MRSDKIYKLFQEMVEEGLLYPKTKADVSPYMRNHPIYCPSHCLIRYALEDCCGFRNWLHKAAKFGIINPLKKYFELSSTCNALTIKERYDEGCNRQDEEDEEPRMINNVRRLFEQARGTKDKGKEKAIDINEDIAQARRTSTPKTQDYNIAACLKKISTERLRCVDDVVRAEIYPYLCFVEP